MNAMIKISTHTAETIWRHGDSELYWLHDDGTESLYEGETIDQSLEYGIEGEVFGSVYPEKSNGDKEYAETSGDQLRVVRQWLEYMELVDGKEAWSYGEIAEVQSVYDLVKDNIYA